MIRHTNLLLVSTLVATIVGCEPPPAGPARDTRANIVMGTEAQVTSYAPDAKTARAATAAAYASFDDVNRLMSDYVADSEIGRLNALHAGESTIVAPETFHCIEQAQHIADLTNGAFDITCRPLVRLWKQAGKDHQLPTEEALHATMQRVGWHKLKLDPATRTVTLTVEGLQVDLGGIAKGYALDLAGQAMRKAGATAGLVDVGGDVLAFGPRPDNQPWIVGVRDPFRSRTDLYCKLALTNAAVATSGTQERYAEIGGKRYSHIVDPRTGEPAEQAPSVTVIAPDGLTADAWATAYSVLTVEEGLALHAQLNLPGVEVLWILPPAEDPKIDETPGFQQYVVK